MWNLNTIKSWDDQKKSLWKRFQDAMRKFWEGEEKYTQINKRVDLQRQLFPEEKCNRQKIKEQYKKNQFHNIETIINVYPNFFSELCPEYLNDDVWTSTENSPYFGYYQENDHLVWLEEYLDPNSFDLRSVPFLRDLHNLVRSPDKDKAAQLIKDINEYYHPTNTLSEESTKEEVKKLIRNSKTEQQWNDNCMLVKNTFWDYPDYWFKEVLWMQEILERHIEQWSITPEETDSPQFTQDTILIAKWEGCGTKWNVCPSLYHIQKEKQKYSEGFYLQPVQRYTVNIKDLENI